MKDVKDWNHFTHGTLGTLSQGDQSIQWTLAKQTEGSTFVKLWGGVELFAASGAKHGFWHLF